MTKSATSRSLTTALTTVLFTALMVGCSTEKANHEMNADSNAAIIGGTDVVEGSALHKSIVGIFNTEKGSLCTGSLLENNIVLTAAHCIGDKPEHHLIIFATDMFAVFNDESREELIKKVRPSVKTVVHPLWGKTRSKPGQPWGDTALIRFRGSVPAGFEPAKLLASNSELTEGATITVAGYGVSQDLLTEVNKGEIPDFNEREAKGEIFCETSEDGTVEKCFEEETSGEGHLRTTELKVAGHFNEIEIAFDQRYGQAACEGDSGGPAYVKQANGEYHLFGVTSRGSRGCNTFVLYSDISSNDLKDWLRTAIAEVSK